MLKNFFRRLGGDPHKREIQKLIEIVNQINALEAEYERKSDDELRSLTAQFRQRLSAGETLDDLLPEAFAAVREASKRTVAMRHFDVQMIGGIVLHRGQIAEMRTGEGKTLVATLPLYLNALTGRGVHLITVNDYLARLHGRWMAQVYQMLGLSVGVLQMAARTDNGRTAFLVDLDKRSPHEDQDQLRVVSRKEAYAADITYGTNSEFGFDYLRDNLTMSLEERVQRGHAFAIVDEVDNILIDEARTPLIISGPAQDEAEWYTKMAVVVRQLNPEDYEINEKDRAVSLTEVGEVHVEQIMGLPLRDPERPEDITPEQARILGYLEQALRAQFLYKKNKDYLVQSGKVVIVDEFTGRLMPGRRWSEGLHQAVEAKEGVKVEPENVTYATITLQNYFRMYDKLAGMTGTALTEAEEFAKIYKLEVLPIPTNLDYQTMTDKPSLTMVEAKDEQNYRYTYYARTDDESKKPVFWRRKDYPDVVYRTEEAKLRAITQEVLTYYVWGRPQLVGTTSVEHSERLSERLSAEMIRRLAQVLLIRQAWMDKNKTDIITRPVPELQPLNNKLDALAVGDLRPVARSLDLSMNPEDPENFQRLTEILNLGGADPERLLKALQAGIPHQVLNARKHDEESIIIARAGAFGAVTIATNMAGRGVDIKLGGELPEEILRDVNRVLTRGDGDPYDLTNAQRRALLQNMPPEEYGIYEESVQQFLVHMENMEKVRQLGGLHVIGSERHESRRIDNQLRGRAARQGDPGSSRFYLSLEDDLMRLFGGQQVEALWKRMFSDENLPIEMGLLGRIVEQSQERVEGANFDVRKHLLEYDDVLNTQRKRIYAQRDRVFTKADLSEDILDMLRTELQGRIPQALKDEEGPWKLLAFLDEIQPPFSLDAVSYPSYALRLLLDDARRPLSKENLTPAAAREALIAIAGRALDAEEDHQTRAAQNVLEHTREALEHQRDERIEALDNFFSSLENADEDEMPQRRPQELLQEASELARIPLRLNNEQLRGLANGERAVQDLIRQQVEDSLVAFGITRLVGALERRLEESLGFRPTQFQGQTWDQIANQVLQGVEDVFARRRERLLGPNGQIARDLDAQLSRLTLDLENDAQWQDLLLYTAQGQRQVFDARTHRRTPQRFNRLNYVYLSARLLQDADPKEVTEDVLAHLEKGLEILQWMRGMNVWTHLVQNQASLQQLDERYRGLLREALGDERYEALAAQPVETFGEGDRDLVIQTLGKGIQNEVNRELLLRVISDQWVDYLTRVEALRVSIGLEAYAQRDPLVQYKSRASEMFQALLGDVRMGVISRLFTFRIRRETRVSLDDEPASEENAPSAPEANEAAKKKKRKRH